MTQDESIKRFTAQIEKLKGHWQSLDIRIVSVRASDKRLNLGTRIILDTKKPARDAQTKSLLATQHVEITQTTRHVDRLPDIISQLEKGALKVGANEILHGMFKGGKLEQPSFMGYQSYRRSERRHSPYMDLTCFYLQALGEPLGNICSSANIDADELDWELRASAYPFDGLNDLGRSFLEVDEAFASNRVVILEVIAPVYVTLADSSELSEGKLTLAVRAQCEIPGDQLTISTILFVPGGGAMRSRSTLEGAELAQDDGISVLRTEIDTEAYAAHAFLSFRGVGIDSMLVYNQKVTLENPRILVHHHFDPELAALREYLFSEKAKGKQLEFAVSWLLHMCGFSVQLYGHSSIIRDETDMMAFVPGTDYVLAVECTGGLPDVKNKLSKLSSRARQVQQNLEYQKVVAVLVTSMRRHEVPVTEREKAGKEGIALVGADEMTELLNAAERQTAPVKILEQLAGWIPREPFEAPGSA